MGEDVSWSHKYRANVSNPVLVGDPRVGDRKPIGRVYPFSRSRWSSCIGGIGAHNGFGDGGESAKITEGSGACEYERIIVSSQGTVTDAAVVIDSAC